MRGSGFESAAECAHESDIEGEGTSLQDGGVAPGCYQHILGGKDVEVGGEAAPITVVGDGPGVGRGAFGLDRAIEAVLQCAVACNDVGYLAQCLR